MQYLIKTLVTSVIVVLIAEIGKRSTLVAALVASLPLTSVLAIIWLYSDTHDIPKIINLSYGVFWVVIPSLLFFLMFPYLLSKGLEFPMALGISAVATALFYTVYVWGLTKIGVKL